MLFHTLRGLLVMKILEEWYVVIVYQFLRFGDTLHYHTSGKCTPSSRFYYDLLDTRADFVCIHQLILKSRSKH